MDTSSSNTVPQSRGELRTLTLKRTSPTPGAFEAFASARRISLSVIFKILAAVFLPNLRIRRKSRSYGITAKFYDASTMIDNEVGRYIYQEYLGKALATGSFRPGSPASGRRCLSPRHPGGLGHPTKRCISYQNCVGLGIDGPRPHSQSN